MVISDPYDMKDDKDVEAYKKGIKTSAVFKNFHSTL